MGNEHSKNKELTKNGKIPEKHENGAVNGISANITSNGLEIGVNGETIILQNAMSTSSNPATESIEQYVIVESNCQHVDAQVISDTPDTTVQKEEEEKKRETLNEDQTDASLPATNPQTESDSSGEEAAATIIVVHQEEFECPHQTAEISTQTDLKTEADISTQTSDDCDSTTYTGSPIEEVAVMETATTEEHSLSESVVVIAEEVVEDTTYEEPLDNQTAGIIITEEVNIENNVYENIVFIAERVEVTDNFEISQIKNYNPEEESINGPEEIEQEITKEPESNPNKSIIVDEISAEENVIEENVPLEVSFSLPKVVADCIEAVFSSVSESSDYTAVNTSEPRVEEVITEDNGERAGDMSADAALIETAEPEPNAVTPEAGEANGVQSLDAEPVTKVIETIFEVIYEEPNATPGDQDMPVKEPSVPLETEILVKIESAHEEVAADDAVAVEDVPEKLSPVSDDESSKSENQIITIEELPEVSLMSPDDEIQIKLQSIPEIIVTEVDVGEEQTDEESEVSFAIVKEDAEVLLEAAIDALCLELEPSAITPLESAADNTSPLEEEVLVATFFVPLSAEKEASFTIPEEPVEETIIPSKDEIVAEKMKEEAIQALLNEFKAVPQSVNKDTAVQETSTEGEVAILEETVEENDMAEEKAEVSDDEPPTEFTEEPVEETIIPSKDEIVAEEMKKEAIQALSNEFEAVPQSVNKDTAVQETSTEGEITILAELVEESDVTGEKVEVSEDGPPTKVTEEPVEETIIPSKDEIVAEEMKKEAIQALSSEFKAVPQSVNKDTAVQETSTEGEITILAELVEESDVAEEKTEVSDEEPPTEVTEEPVEETIIPSKDEIVAEEMKKEAIQALSNEFEAVPQSVNKDIAVQETSTEGEVAILEEPVGENDVIEEKIEVSEDEPPTKVTEEPVEETIIPSKDEIVAEEMNKEAIQALSNEFEAVPQSVNKDTAVQETSTEGEITILAELVEESDVTGEKVEVSEDELPTKVTEEPVEETIIPSKDEIVAEEMKKEAIQALSSEFKAVPQSVNKDIAVQETSTEGEITILAELVEESDVAEEKAEVSDEEPPTEVTEEPVEETIIPSKDEIVAEEMKEEVIQALSNEFEAVPQSVNKDTAVQETSTEGEIAISEDPVEENDVTKEKIEVSEDELPTEVTEKPVEETIIPPKDETVAEEMKEEAIQALSNEFEAVPQSVDEDIAVQETSTEGEVAISEEPMEESDVAEEKTEDEPLTEATEEPEGPREENVAAAEVLLEDADEERVTPSVVALEILESSPVISEEAVVESVSSLEQLPKGGVRVLILKITEDFTEEIIYETDHSRDVSAAVADNTEDSQVAALDESVAACIEAIVEKIITEDVVEAECNPVTSEDVAPEIVTDAEQKAEDESSVNTTVPSPNHWENMEAVLVKLQLACASVVEESAYKLSGLVISSQGYSIYVTIHVAPKMEQQ